MCSGYVIADMYYNKYYIVNIYIFAIPLNNDY